MKGEAKRLGPLPAAEPPVRGYGAFVEVTADGWLVHRIRLTRSQLTRATVASEVADLPQIVIGKIEADLADYAATDNEGLDE